jgi:hypothetical protein
MVKMSSKSNKNWLWNNVLKKCGFIWNTIYIVKNFSDIIIFAGIVRSWLFNDDGRRIAHKVQQ